MKTAIIVLGNPPRKDGTIPYNLKTRLDKALKEYEKHPGSVLIFTGGLTYTKYVEAIEMKKYCVDKGIKEADILLETEAKSTYDNAFYVAKILKDIKYEKIIIVTSRCHKKISKLIFKHYFKEFEISIPKLTPMYLLHNIHIYLWEIYLVIKLEVKGDKRLERIVENNINNI